VTALRWLAFGDRAGAVWGLAWIPGDNGHGHAALGTGIDSWVVDAELEGSDAGEQWRLRARGLELAISSGGDVLDADGDGLEGFAQLADASGNFTLDGAQHAVEARAWRAALRGLPASGELDSVRLLAGWFGDDEALALLALRPGRARGHEDDVVTAALVERGKPRSVSDRRLSTTYTGEGVPSRAGVELWVSEPAEEPGTAGELGTAEEPGTAEERAHRVAGEAAGAGATWTEGTLELGVEPFRWHSHDRDGTGVFLLGRS
jgi:hypothetical protein